MNPYNRFTTVSNLMAASITIGAVLAFGMPAFDAVSQLSGGQTGPALMASTGASLALLVVGWLAMTEVIFPLVFRLSTVRKLVLGKYYIEGTWLQAERSQDEKRMSVIDIQPDGNRFIFSGYSLNEDLEIESNIMIEFSRFEWPFMVYKYRNSLSDGGDGRRDGVGEIQLEMNRSSARRYNGFLQYVKSDERLKIEGAKLTRSDEVNQLRRLDGRQSIFEKYWKLFFHRAMRPSNGMTYPLADEYRPAQLRQQPSPDQQFSPAMAEHQPDLGEMQPVAHAPSASVTPTRPHASYDAMRGKVSVKVQPVNARRSARPVGVDGTPIERRRSPQGQRQSQTQSVVPRRRASDWSDQATSQAERPIIRRPQNGAALNGTDSS